MAVKLNETILYPKLYAAFVLLAALDITLTWSMLVEGGYELNPVAMYFLRRWGLSGLVWLKFGIVALVLCICEVVGRHRPLLGRRLAAWAVALNCIPVAVALAQIFFVARQGG